MIRRWAFPALLISALSFIALAALSGVIGNLASVLFEIGGSLVAKSVEANLGIWIVGFIICLVCITLLFMLRTLTRELSGLNGQVNKLTIEINRLTGKLDGNNQWFELADSSLRLVPSLISTVDLDGEMRRFVKKLLASATHVFPKVYGSSLFLPDPSNKEDLVIWEYYQVPTDSAIQAKCYIGPARPGRKRGVAGEAFIRQEIIVARIMNEKDDNGQWKFDKESYVPFTTEGTYPAFNAFACAPIVIGAAPGDCVGVICVDSIDPAAFDSADVQEILLRLGRYIGAALQIYRALRNKQE